MAEAIDIGVIGSGLGGLSIARKLEEAGADYVVLDKGRTPGGRAATRRFADSRFDHGLPWLTAKGPLTGELIGLGAEAGVLQQLDVPGPDEPAWFSPSGISALGKHLAKGLKIKNRVRVTGIRQADGCLVLDCDTDTGPTQLRVKRKLYVTAPLPQALELVEPLVGETIWDGAEPFEKSIVVMLQADPGTVGPARTGDLVPDHLKFPDVKPGFSLRLTAEDSDRLFEAGEEQIRAFVAEALDTPVRPESIQLMKWRYANGSGAVKDPFFRAEAGPVSIAICGDAFGGGRAEGTEASLMSCRAAYEGLDRA